MLLGYLDPVRSVDYSRPAVNDRLMIYLAHILGAVALKLVLPGIKLQIGRNACEGVLPCILGELRKLAVVVSRSISRSR